MTPLLPEAERTAMHRIVGTLRLDGALTSGTAAEREYGYVPVSDGCELAYVLWRAADEAARPTILNYSAYDEGAARLEKARRFLDAGYNFLGVNVRGTGASGGEFSYYHPSEGEDGADIIAWAARQPWCDGNIGMVGASYGGHTQIKVAALRPANLRAIVPIATDGCDYRDEAMAGGIFNAGMLAHWSFTEQPARARAGIEERLVGGDADAGAKGQDRNLSFFEAREHPFYDDWWRARSLDLLAADVRVPALFIHAWQDEWIRPNGALRLFSLLGSPAKRIILQNGPHRLSGYGLNRREQMRWLDRWVKGIDNGAERDHPIQILWEAVETEDADDIVPGWSTGHRVWPPEEIAWTSMTMTASGELDPDQHMLCPADGERRYIYPLATENPGSDESFQAIPLPLGCLHYHSAPMPDDMAILGAPRLTLYFSVDRRDVDFQFTLKDIDPEGNALYLQRALLRASLRGIDETLSDEAEIVQSFAGPEPLEPGKIVRAVISFAALGHVVRKGHRIELSILAPPATPSPVWSFVGQASPVVVTIQHGRDFPSHLALPVLVGLRAQAAPPDKRMRNQPVRRSAAGE